METLQEIFKKETIDERILKAFGNRRLILFLGAGISRLMGVPGWDDLSNSLIEKAFTSYKERRSILDSIKSSKEKITIAYQKFHEDGKEEEFFDIFGDAFNNEKIEQNKTLDNNIYKILSRFKATFLTTNADSLFEDELGSAVCHTDLDVSIIQRDNGLATGHLFYLHGKYTDDLEQNKNMVFTADSYVKKYNNPSTIDFLKMLLSNDDFTVVFLGYGLNEFELIDYVVTKANINVDPQKQKRLFVVEGFLSNQDEIYRARKKYFENLNIELLPYSLDNSGYNELKRLLESWDNELREKANIPSLVNDEIEECVKGFNDINSNRILHILENKSCDVQNELKIFNEVVRSDECEEWISFFIKKKLYTDKYLEKIIENGNKQWPLLGLLNYNVQIYRRDEAQTSIANMIDGIISNKDVNILEYRYMAIMAALVESILHLDGKHLKIEHIIFLKSIIEKFGYSVMFSKYDDFRFTPFNEWSVDCLKEFLTIMSNSIMPLCNWNEMNSYYHEKILTALRNSLQSEDANEEKKEILFQWMIELIDEDTKDSFDTLKRIYNIDNVDKAHYKDCELIVKEAGLVFLSFNTETQNKIVNNLFANRNGALNKFALYFCRLAGLDLNIFINHIVGIVDNDNCICELYLCLERCNSLSEENEVKLFKKILESKLGFENIKIDLELEKFIESKRLALIKHMRCEEAREYMAKNKIIEPCDLVKRADDCDYVHISDVEYEFKFKDDEDYLSGVKSRFASSNKLLHSQIVSDSLNVLLSKDDDKFTNIMYSIKEEDAEFTNWFILNLFLRRKDISDGKKLIVYELCLEILNEMEYEVDHVLYHNCFRFVANEEIGSSEVASLIESCLDKWLQIDDDIDYLNQAGDIYNAFLNHISYDKFRLFVNYLIYIKETKKHIEHKKIIENLETIIGINKSARYCLAYNLQNLFYVLEENIKFLLSKLLFKSEYNELDIDALMFCTLWGNRINKYLIEYLIDNEVIQRNSEQIKQYGNKQILKTFYCYIIATYMYGKLSFSICEGLVSDQLFIESYM